MINLLLLSVVVIKYIIFCQKRVKFIPKLICKKYEKKSNYKVTCQEKKLEKTRKRNYPKTRKEKNEQKEKNTSMREEEDKQMEKRKKNIKEQKLTDRIRKKKRNENA